MAPLAWQSSSAMGANGGSNTSTDATASNQGPAQGTEYTLQGMCGTRAPVVSSTSWESGATSNIRSRYTTLLVHDLAMDVDEGPPPV